uniref:CD44 antigen n=1 Tax=Hydatigena taeniaeformis TaxID=6205 RepID=A0A0R3XCW0_HYDTA
LKATISKVDADADLSKWSHAHGVDMPHNFPTFQEYSPEVCALSKKGKSVLADGNSGGVTLTSVKTITSPDRGGPTGGTTDTGSVSTSSPVHTTDYASNNYDHGSDGITTSNDSTPEVGPTNKDELSDSPKSPEQLTSDIDQVDTSEEHLIEPTTTESCSPPEAKDAPNSIQRNHSSSSIQSTEGYKIKPRNFTTETVDKTDKESQKLIIE